ncbi:ankyrin repeat-containing domain protein [Fusarium acuminatum]|uniref:Ankyrin repeat-containing domain protein n=1 Tax=Fusarium acuminatum TaxID=5515 RepID=A0ABZ2WZA1_9HYPO
MTTTTKDMLITMALAGEADRLKNILSNNQESLSEETTQEILTVAVKNSQLEVINLLLSQYPSVSLNEQVVRGAVNTGSIPTMGALLARDPSVITMPFDHYGSPLIVACMGRQRYEYLKYLLEAGADPNQYPDAATFPLAIVAALYKDPAVIDLLLSYGARLESSGSLGATARLGNEIMIRHLLSRGARSDTDDTSGGSPLHTAVKAGHVGVAKILLQYGADPKVVDSSGDTPIGVAEKMRLEGKDMTEMLEVLRGY